MANKSESIKELAAALAAAQAEMPAAELNAVNPFLKNKFADLGSVLSTAIPVLAEHGLSISQLPVAIDGNIGITTVLLHKSGEWLESTITLPIADEKGKSLAQVAGSIITYLRRYSVASVLGMYAEEDSDGNAPSQRKPKPSTSRKPTPREGKSGPAQVKADKVPASVTELYTRAQSEFGLDTRGAVAILVAWLEENHAADNIGAYIKTGGPEAIATLWAVLREAI